MEVELYQTSCFILLFFFNLENQRHFIPVKNTLVVQMNNSETTQLHELDNRGRL